MIGSKNIKKAKKLIKRKKENIKKLTLKKERRKRIKRTKKNIKNLKKDLKKLTLKQKAITTGMSMGIVGSVVLPLPGVTIGSSALTHKYIKRSIKKFKTIIKK